MSLDLEGLRKVLKSFEALVSKTSDETFMSCLDDVTRFGLKAGVILNFESSYELCWKFLQRWIRENVGPEEANHPRTRKDLFRIAARYGLINDPSPWFAYGDARNLTSYTYSEKIADEVYEVALRFISDAGGLLEKLDSAND